MKHDADFENNSTWFLESSIVNFFLMRNVEINFMLMIFHTFYKGSYVFKTFGNNISSSYKFINLIFSCTGGGILVPVFINENDKVIIAVIISFTLHVWCPILRK